MTVYKRGGVWWMNFRYRGIRYQESTGQITKEAADAVERARRDDLRQEAHGVAIRTPMASPAIQDWSEIYYAFVAPRLLRPDAKAHVIAAVLRFWGARPDDPVKRVTGAPYHNLTLGAVVEDPHWIVRFETWMTEREISAQTKNHYRSLMHDMFKIATHPQWRSHTGVLTNPFAGQWRDPKAGRTTTIASEDLRAIIGAASFHLRLAMAIALLAPKFRLANILGLTWRDHVAPDFSRITVEDHKTRRQTKRPLIAHVPEQLRTILKDAKRRAGRSPYVITYQGKPIKRKLSGSVAGAVKRAAAGGATHLVYGRAAAKGITFHTLRHTAATLLAELDVAPEKRQQLMGHADIATTMLYTHLTARHEIEPAEQLSRALPIADLVMATRMRPPVASPVTTGKNRSGKTGGKSRTGRDTPKASARSQT